MGKVGSADARLCSARDLVRIVTGELATDPLVFLRPPEEGCEECDTARASVARARSRTRLPRAAHRVAENGATSSTLAGET